MHEIQENRTKKILKSLLPWIAFFGLLLLVLKTANAESYLGPDWDRYLEDVQGFQPTNRTGEELAINFILNAIRIVRNVIGGIALVMGVLYGVRLVIARGQEDVITKQKMNFVYALLGFLILIISENVASVFNPEASTNEQLIDFGAARDQLRDIVSYLKWLLGSVFVLLMTISGLRMIMAQGEEETITKEKRNLTWSLMGMLLILLASNIVNAIYVINSPAETTAAGSDVAVYEIAGVIKLILIFLGPLAIAFTLFAGFMYLTALDNEDRTQKAKRMVVYGIVSIITIYAAFAIVNTITSANLEVYHPYLA